jgi:hypothetical protein
MSYQVLLGTIRFYWIAEFVANFVASVLNVVANFHILITCEKSNIQ